MFAEPGNFCYLYFVKKSVLLIIGFFCSGMASAVGLSNQDFEKSQLCQSSMCIMVTEQKVQKPSKSNLKIFMTMASADGVQYVVSQIIDSSKASRYFSITYSLDKSLAKDEKQFLSVSRNLKFLNQFLKTYTGTDGNKIISEFVGKKDIAIGSLYKKAELIYKMKVFHSKTDGSKLTGMLLVYGEKDSKDFGHFPK